MWQNAATDTTVTVQDLLAGSVLQHYDLQAAAPPVILGAQYFVWTFIFMILFCLVFRGQISVFLSWAVEFLLIPVKRTYSDTSAAVRYGLPVSVVMLLPVAAYLAYGTAAVHAGYGLVLAVLSGYVLLRFLLLCGIGYVSGEKELVTAVHRFSCLAFMTVTVLFCVVLIVGMFLPDIYPVLTGKVSIVLGIIVMLVYLIGLTRIFFAFGEPPLLTILYLCTLEILPVAAAATSITRY